MPFNVSSITSALGSLTGAKSPIPSPTTSDAAPAAGADFGSMLKDAIGTLDSLGQQADDSSLKLATGQPVDIHDVMLNSEQASLGFQLALQVRNKLVDAYSEIMRMSI
jgi:flagellar hook-basal body complex protein FliE